MCLNQFWQKFTQTVSKNIFLVISLCDLLRWVCFLEFFSCPISWISNVNLLCLVLSSVSLESNLFSSILLELLKVLKTVIVFLFGYHFLRIRTQFLSGQQIIQTWHITTICAELLIINLKNSSKVSNTNFWSYVKCPFCLTWVKIKMIKTKLLGPLLSTNAIVL